MSRTDRISVHRWHINDSGVKVFGWTEMNVDDALKAGEKYGKCVECGEHVTIHETTPPHPEHRKRNPRCSLSDVAAADRLPRS